MELSLFAVLLVGFAFAPGSYGQGDVTGTTEGSYYLQPWLVGLAAVVGFLGLVFVASLVNRIFFANQTKDEEESIEEKDLELRAKHNIYENPTMELEDEIPSSKAKMEDETLTSM